MNENEKLRPIVVKGEAKLLVRDEKCEQYVLGTMLSYGHCYNDVAEFLDADCFFNDTHKGIYEAIRAVALEGNNTDIINVMAELNKEGSTIEPYVLAELSSYSIYANLEHYALRLKELSTRRKMWYIAQRMISVGTEETDDVSEVREMAIDSINGLFEKSQNVYTLEDSIKSLNEMIQINLSGGKITGTATGFKRMDEKGGLQKSDLIIIAGETSQGKTSLALTMVCNAIRKDAKIAMYSLEMTRQQLSARLISSLSGVPANQILYSSSLNPGELENIDRARGMLPGNNLFFDDSSTSNIESILISIRSMKLKYNIDGAVVDFLQIVGVNDKRTSREQQMGDVSRRLKNIAKELNIWVIALSQLSRDNNNPVPNLNRLRDSGQIGEAADVVMLVYRPEYYHRDNYPSPFEDSSRFPVDGTALVDVAKGRNIGTFQFFLGFNKNTTTFYETDRIEEIEIPESERFDAPPVDDDMPF